MSYRNDLEAALARNTELEHELTRSRAALLEVQKREAESAFDLAEANARLVGLGGSPVLPRPRSPDARIVASSSPFVVSLKAVAALSCLATLALSVRSESKGVAAAHWSVTLVCAWLGARRREGQTFASQAGSALVGALVGLVAAIAFFQGVWRSL